MDQKHDEMHEELRQLLDAMAGRAEDYLRGGVPHDENDSQPACGWCPLCAAVAFLRGHRPELRDQLAGIVQALRQLLAEQRPEAAEPESSEEDAAASKVQHIRVQRVGGPVLGGDGAEAVPRC